ncbi:MAG TPA: YbaK/EbsC family protein [Candidatus Nanoarchaeia archaeon]|nr:YbaK/EbsC family protein [Candidatus Nanoarchaeia archaeon]
MIDRDKIYNKIIKILNDNQATYKIFSHKAAFTYDELRFAQEEVGFIGIEGKCLVVKKDDGFVVCVTIQGKKLNFSKLKEILSDKDLRLAKPEELKEYFGAEPGCAYPFGFDESIKIYVDPTIYDQEWFLFSPLFATKTIQVRGSGLRRIFFNLKNKTVMNREIFI